MNYNDQHFAVTRYATVPVGKTEPKGAHEYIPKNHLPCGQPSDQQRW